MSQEPTKENPRPSASNPRSSALNLPGGQEGAIRDHPCPSVAKRRGGRRPGAGAPKGNLNGLKHGLYSRQMAALGVAFSAHPKLQEGLLALAKRQHKKNRKAELVAAQIFTNIIKRGGLQPTNEWQARELKDFQDAFDRN